uniref:Uncharacterized protein n=1 Tax=Arundo donax TaxID=35708 RepID=A0A0A9FE48_ARUDO
MFCCSHLNQFTCSFYC